MNVTASKGPTIPQRSFAAAEWRLVTIGTMRRETPTMTRTRTTTPNRTTIASRRLSENPTKT